MSRLKHILLFEEYTEKDYIIEVKSKYDEYYSFIIKSKYDDNVIGTLSSVLDKNKKVINLDEISISPMYQKQNYGTILMVYFIDYCKTNFNINKIELVAASYRFNQISQTKLVNFYKKFGFEISDSAKDEFDKKENGEYYGGTNTHMILYI